VRDDFANHIQDHTVGVVVGRIGIELEEFQQLWSQTTMKMKGGVNGGKIIQLNRRRGNSEVKKARKEERKEGDILKRFQNIHALIWSQGHGTW
jgi:hypothetical protein